MKPHVKICGITRLKDALAATECGANALGFIFYNKSPRYVQPQIASEIISHLHPLIIPVGVFVNAKRDEVREIIQQTKIKVLQFSGDESPEECDGYELPVIKSFRLSNVNEIERIRSFSNANILLDSGGNDEYGGTGKRVDNPIANIVCRKYPSTMLAGGISPENVREIIASVHPFAIDVNSGVEDFPGVKSEKKIQTLFAQIDSPQ